MTKRQRRARAKRHAFQLTHRRVATVAPREPRVNQWLRWVKQRQAFDAAYTAWRERLGLTDWRV